MITVHRRKIRTSPDKLRLVTRQIAKMPVDKASLTLANLNKQACYEVNKLLKSAVDAATGKNLDKETLFIYEIRVDEGAKLKRIVMAARGRTNRIVKRSSHLTITLDSKKIEEKPKDPKKKRKVISKPEEK